MRKISSIVWFSFSFFFSFSSNETILSRSCHFLLFSEPEIYARCEAYHTFNHTCLIISERSCQAYHMAYVLFFSLFIFFFFPSFSLDFSFERMRKNGEKDDLIYYAWSVNILPRLGFLLSGRFRIIVQQLWSRITSLVCIATSLDT